ncbi:MAG TPA: hypothetical protein VG734_21955 [Lacunisphaera sp.]|nr:hypothetical protein [Lacunisphaera sp.]
MSESSNFSFPHRTPVFTALVVIACFAAFVWLGRRIYTPGAGAVQAVEGVRTPAERKEILRKNREKEADESTHYAWIDQKAGVVRVPIDRAIELTVRDHAKK